jgi:hypothetical protein
MDRRRVQRVRVDAEHAVFNTGTDVVEQRVDRRHVSPDQS